MKENWIADNNVQLTILKFDDQLNTTSIAYVKTGNVNRGDMKIKDIDNDDYLFAFVDQGKRLVIKFIDREFNDLSKTFITSRCANDQNIVSLAFEYKTK